MKKNEMDATCLLKKRYVKPTSMVVPIRHSTQLLAGSLTGVSATGLDDEEQLELVTNPESIWNLAK